jgi:flagellum-specific peptidoglycan hydrolase FlgJ
MKYFILLAATIIFIASMTHMTTLSLNDSNSNITAVKNASKAVFQNDVLANLAAAQSILESNLYGKPSSLAYNNNNLFGIKGSGTAGSVTKPTKEYIKGKWITVHAQFAANNSLEDSFQQFKKVLDLPRYKAVQDAETFEEAAKAVWKGGYATDPNYPSELIAIYNKYLK